MELILKSIVVFASTNIDDIFILMLFFGNRSYSTKAVILGQYLGISTLVLLSFIGSLLNHFVDETIPALPVQDIKASCAYYTNRLGFTIRHQEKTFAIAVRDDIEIHLWQSCDKSWKWRSIF